tara:strand:- start:12143 stop:13876 length:1734 start_codon:yes stop_codon:yes gene_type:complete
MSIIEKLTEGIVNRDMKAEGHALLNKWEATGLLEGLDTQHDKATMSRLLENQAKELLREASTMEAGNVEGFASVAFPIVRRVFAGLIANDLVSVQPMSLPSGLIFFLDFSYGTAGRLGSATTDSIYGQGVLGSEVTGGVQLTSENLDKQPYGFSSAYSSPTGEIAVGAAASATFTVVLDGFTAAHAIGGTGFDASKINYDPDLLSEHDGKFLLQVSCLWSDLETGNNELNRKHVSQVFLPMDTIDGIAFTQVRRLTSISADGLTITFTYLCDSQLVDAAVDADLNNAVAGEYPIKDTFGDGNGLGSVQGGLVWGLENEEAIPEIDIKVDSIAITAMTKKLKAKWTPELGQDLNAYHNLDAEVELTSILSEQIALEIDREILADLVNGATAGKFYWSRSPGLFVDRTTGAEVGAGVAAPDFTGTVSEWYETLIETINDVSAQIHRKTLRGGANYVVCSPEVANILEFTSGFRANVAADADKGMIGAQKTGSLSRKFDVIVDPYFPRNAILVGRKGGSFLESGYVYAPYVPLQTTPTIFGVEDFVPRKGVMTRYGKKMVRPDMYGMVIVRGLLGESGGT